ncbi:MAG: hypothetical protein CMQ29_02670 [Gammaproteobacteria bacterium]|nr:hypothetical protein [Gammaproteobacteria bacterium]
MPSLRKCTFVCCFATRPNGGALRRLPIIWVPMLVVVENQEVLSDTLGNEVSGSQAEAPEH